MKRFRHFPLLGILALGLFLRIFGINWDDYSHLHPDERFLTDVVAQLGDPDKLTEGARQRCPDGEGVHDFFDTRCSALNPNNLEEGSFAYGTLPLFIVRGAAQILVGLTGEDHWDKYDYVQFVGRGVNALADTLTIFFVYLIGGRLFSARAGLIAAGLYAFAVLPIQLAHFWTVDIIAGLFFVIGLYAALEIGGRGAYWAYLLFGAAYGAALASRINLFPMLILLPLAAGFHLYTLRGKVTQRRYVVLGWTIVLVATGGLLLAGLIFRIGQPYAFVGPRFMDFGDLNQKWLDDIVEVSDLSRVYKEGWPPSNQWYDRIKYAYPWFNMAVWGMGMALGGLASLALLIALYRQYRDRRLSPPLAILALWILAFFALQGGVHVMTMRYYLPLYVPLCLLVGWMILLLRGRPRKVVASAALGATLIWAFAFTSIYRHPLTRLEASRWMVEQFPSTITLQNEEGDRLPANLSDGDLRFPLTTVFNGESYISQGFEVTRSMKRITGFWMDFSDAGAGTINLRFVGELDMSAETPLASFTIPVDETGHARLELTPDSFPILRPGFYRWHIDTHWEGEKPFRYFMPLVEWEDEQGERLRSPITFLSPYQSVGYVHISPTQAQELSVQRPFTATRLIFPHYMGPATLLEVHVGNETTTARPLGVENADHPLGGSRSFELDRALTFEPDQPTNIRARDPIFITGTAIATEGGWDDAVPWSYCADPTPDLTWKQFFRPLDQCQGINAYALGYFPELALNMAEPDAHTKHLRLIDILYKADYLTLSSNRFYDALPRNPMRFPLSTEFYKRLFDGRLHYRLEREFARFPQILGITLRDQVLPTADLPRWANELEAEEAFTVYDHPTVFIFRNVGFAFDDLPPTFNRRDDRNRIDLDDYAATTFTAPAATVTNALVRRTTFFWVIGLLLLGWVSFPLMYVLFPMLPLRGFPFGRGIAWLLLSLIGWWLAATVGHPFWTRAALWGLVLLFGGLNLLLAYQHRAGMRQFWRENRRALLGIEALFLIALVFGLLLRAVDPDLWHPERGGEKPMDFAYLNAVLRTSHFPPPNPWLAGFAINYYYFGFVIAALPIKLGNFAPEIGVNLFMGSLYAIIFVNVFALVYWLLGRAAPRLRTGLALAGSLFVMAAGNFGTLVLLIDPEKDMHPNRWYWYPTRILGESKNGAGGAINEVPFFSFLYGDLHAHIIGLLPVTLFILSALVLLRERKLRWGIPLGMLAAVIYMTNTWDVLLYAPLGAILMLLAARSLRRFMRFSLVVGLAGLITILPFYLHFTLGENSGFERWKFEKSLLEPFLLVWGIPLGVIGIWLIYRLKGLLVPDADAPVELGMIILVAAALIFLPSTTATTVLCLILLILALILGRFDAPETRPAHFGIALIALLFFAMEYIVVKNDVGRMNTVFKTSFQIWLWLGLLLPVLIYHLLEKRLRWQAGTCLLLMGVGLLYPIKSIPARHVDSQTGNYTLDGNQFMQAMTLYNGDNPLVLARDAALTRWMRDRIDGFPIIAEYYEREYWWNSRISVQTGLPSVVGWANHMRQQYSHQLPEVEQRVADIRILYTTNDIQEVRRILRDYGVQYVVMGELEQSAMTPEAKAIFAQMIEDGELRVVYDYAFTRLLKVEKLAE